MQNPGWRGSTADEVLALLRIEPKLRLTLTASYGLREPPE